MFKVCTGKSEQREEDRTLWPVTGRLRPVRRLLPLRKIQIQVNSCLPPERIDAWVRQPDKGGRYCCRRGVIIPAVSPVYRRC